MTVKIPSTLVSVITFGAFFNAYIIDHKEGEPLSPPEDRTILDNIQTNVVNFIKDIMYLKSSAFRSKRNSSRILECLFQGQFHSADQKKMILYFKRRDFIGIL